MIKSKKLLEKEYYKLLSRNTCSCKWKAPSKYIAFMHLQWSGPGCTDYLDCVMTVQLECVVGSVCLIRVFGWSSLYKCMDFKHPIISVIWTYPGSNYFRQVRVHCTGIHTFYLSTDIFVDIFGIIWIREEVED